MLRKFLSYLVPITIYKTKSDFSKTLEVTYNNGELVIDSLNTNYSYGSLQRILAKGLRFIGKDTIDRTKHILILGVAGGSIIKTLKEEYSFVGKITGVEIDADIIEIANKYFHLNKLENVEIIIDDAFEFVLKSTSQYDMIVIDIFQDMNMPNFLFEKYFVERLEKITALNGFILFNTMVLQKSHQERNDNYIGLYTDRFKKSKLSKIEKHNELFIMQKIN